MLLACLTASLAIWLASWTLCPIAWTEEVISSAVFATDWTLLETSCEAAAASEEVLPVLSAVVVRVFAAASSSVEDNDRDSISLPMTDSNSRVTPSTRIDRAIFAFASAAAASSEFFW